MKVNLDIEFFHRLNDSYHRMSPEQMAEINRGSELMNKIEELMFEIAGLRCHFQRQTAANLMVSTGSNIGFQLRHHSDLLTITFDD